MQINTSKLAAYDGIELKEATFRKQSFPVHFHDSYSIGIIEKGIEQVSFERKNILAHANAVIIINPYEVHSNTYFDNDSWKYRIIYVSIELMHYFQNLIGLHTNKTIWFPQYLIDDPHLYQLLLRFHLQSNNVSSLETALTYLISTYAKERPESFLTGYTGLVNDAVGYLHNHLTEKITIEDIATLYKTDKYKLIRAFKKQTGLTPISYLLLHRINKSKTLIAQDMPMTDIALETGFYDQSHFNHYFRKYIGITPLAYRKGLSSNQ